MELKEVVDLISTNGFAIAISIYLIYSGQKKDTKYTEAIEQLRKTVDNNSNIIQRLYDKIK